MDNGEWEMEVLRLIDADVRFDWAMLGLWIVVFALALLEGGCA